MKLYLISDNIDTHTGMRLAGIEGVVVHNREDALAALEEARAIPGLGVLLVTEKLATFIPEEIEALRLGSALPIVVVVPDRHGTRRPPNSITRYVNESIGIKF